MTAFKKIIIPCIFILLGLILFAYPMFLDPNRMPGDLGDARFINYILEHGFLWLNQVPQHQEFWSPPEFYPFKNTLVFSDVMLGGMIIYCPIRFFVKDPQNAFQIFFLISHILNFITFYFFTKRVFKFNTLCSSIGAFFFAFNLPRFAQTGHIQLLMQFIMILPIWCICEIKKEKPKKKNLILFSLACFSFVLLMYTTFYFAWYLCFGAFLGTLIVLCFKKSREQLIDFLKLFKPIFILPVIISLILISFLVYKYLSINYVFHEYYLVRFINVFSTFSWFDMMILNFLPSSMGENNIGIGAITSILALYATFKSKYKYQILLFIIVSYLIFTNREIITWLISNVFAFKTIRALGRFIFLLLPIYAILIAFLFQSLKNKLIWLIVFSLFMIEQVPFHKTFRWTKIQHQRRIERMEVPKECEVFYSRKHLTNAYENVTENIDAIYWASKNGKTTCNGYGIFVGNPSCEIPKNCVIQNNTFAKKIY